MDDALLAKLVAFMMTWREILEAADGKASLNDCPAARIGHKDVTQLLVGHSDPVWPCPFCGMLFSDSD